MHRGSSTLGFHESPSPRKLKSSFHKTMRRIPHCKTTALAVIEIRPGSLQFCARCGHFLWQSLCRAVQSAPHEQGADVGVAAGEVTVKIQRLTAPATREQRASESITV